VCAANRRRQVRLVAKPQDRAAPRYVKKDVSWSGGELSGRHRRTRDRPWTAGAEPRHPRPAATTRQRRLRRDGKSPGSFVDAPRFSRHDRAQHQGDQRHRLGDLGPSRGPPAGAPALVSSTTCSSRSPRNRRHSVFAPSASSIQGEATSRSGRDTHRRRIVGNRARHRDPGRALGDKERQWGRYGLRAADGRGGRLRSRSTLERAAPTHLRRPSLTRGVVGEDADGARRHFSIVSDLVSPRHRFQMERERAGQPTHHMSRRLFKGFGPRPAPALARGTGRRDPSTKGGKKKKKKKKKQKKKKKKKKVL